MMNIAVSKRNYFLILHLSEEDEKNVEKHT